MLGLAPTVAFVPTTDLGRSRPFYEKVLGLRLQDDTGYACVFRSGATEVRVTKVDHLEPQPFTLLGWVVSDIEQAVDELASGGVVFRRYELLDQDERGVWTSPEGDRVAWFADPDGNTLSITQHPAEA
jgi:catechol 2,3-dioxygenase-like lactoylglutathione lyase family enzyme